MPGSSVAQQPCARALPWVLLVITLVVTGVFYVLIFYTLATRH